MQKCYSYFLLKVWLVIHCKWQMTCATQNETHDACYVTHDTCYVTHDTCYMTDDTWHMTGGGSEGVLKLFSQRMTCWLTRVFVEQPSLHWVNYKYIQLNFSLIKYLFKNGGEKFKIQEGVHFTLIFNRPHAATRNLPQIAPLFHDHVGCVLIWKS